MLVRKIEDLFLSEKQINIEEKINSFSINVQCGYIITINKTQLTNILSLIDDEDVFYLSTQVSDDEVVVLENYSDIDEYIQKFNDSITYFEDTDRLTLKLEISKSKDRGERIIYSYIHFLSFWNKIEPINLLSVINDILKLHSFLKFKTLEENIPSISGHYISFNKEFALAEIKDNYIYLKDNCHFGNSDNFQLTPDTFYIVDRTNQDLVLKFDILCALFSIIYLFDITLIEGSSLSFKLNGYKSISGKIEVGSAIAKCKAVYYEIYSWCYSSEGNLTDKLGLARNLISLSTTEEITKLDDSVIISIKSAHKAYLKENISKYLEIRSKIITELDWISQKSSEIIEKYLSGYQKSIFTFLSFFISVFVLRILSSASFLNVFTKDATVLSFAFLIMSVIYLIFSSLTLRSERKRLIRKYDNIKGRFKDLLIETDINNILKDDEEFKYELTFIRNRFLTYLWLWIITIITLFAAILFVSSYVNWETLIELIKN
jgi:hypothetical protein